MARSKTELLAQVRVEMSIKESELLFLKDILGEIEDDIAEEKPKAAKKPRAAKKPKPEPEVNVEVEVVKQEDGTHTVTAVETEVYEAEPEPEKKTKKDVAALIKDWSAIEGNDRKLVPQVFKEATGLESFRKHVTEENATEAYYAFKAHSTWEEVGF